MIKTLAMFKSFKILEERVSKDVVNDTVSSEELVASAEIVIDISQIQMARPVVPLRTTMVDSKTQAHIDTDRLTAVVLPGDLCLWLDIPFSEFVPLLEAATLQGGGSFFDFIPK